MPQDVLESSTRVAVVGRDGQRALICAVAAQAGDTLFFIEGVPTRTPTRYTVQVGSEEHIDVPEDDRQARYLWRFMNHSCDPTASVVGRFVVARRPLRRGEEITFDYDTTEYEMSEPFDCHCRKADCRGRVRGYRHLSPSARAELAGRVGDHLVPRDR